MVRALLTVALLLLALPGAADARWHPAPGLRWQWQLSEPPRAPFLSVDAYDVDGQETPRATVRALHRRGVRAICYLSAGSWERRAPTPAATPRPCSAGRWRAGPASAGSTCAGSTARSP